MQKDKTEKSKPEPEIQFDGAGLTAELIFEILSVLQFSTLCHCALCHQTHWDTR